MFTEEQIKLKHSKVKSGADFPNYIKDLKHLGVISYEILVNDGRTIYFGEDNYSISSQVQYNELSISEDCNLVQFRECLKEHQQGKTNYQTFCEDCAKSGIKKWVVLLKEMKCTYYDKKDNEILVEKIPE
ncbi:MAG: DUF1398 family protein [Candidatus Sericytochromatia bacterium]